MADIKAALAKLDVANDNHWTQDGAPRLDTVKMFAGDQSVTREMVAAAAPGFTRTTALQGGQAEQAAPVVPNDAPSEQAAASVAQPDPAQQTAEQDKPDDADVGAKELDNVVAPAVATEDETDEASPLDIALENLNHAKANLEQGLRYQADVNKGVKIAQAEVDRLQAIYDKLAPSDTNTDAVQAYLAQQRALLEQRAEQMRKVQGFENAMGVRLADLIPRRSPLDAALSRKNSRGQGRPGVKK
jgi:hypothetical protein